MKKRSKVLQAELTARISAEFAEEKVRRLLVNFVVLKQNLAITRQQCLFERLVHLKRARPFVYSIHCPVQRVASLFSESFLSASLVRIFTRSLSRLIWPRVFLPDIHQLFDYFGQTFGQIILGNVDKYLRAKNDTQPFVNVND